MTSPEKPAPSGRRRQEKPPHPGRVAAVERPEAPDRTTDPTGRPAADRPASTGPADPPLSVRLDLSTFRLCGHLAGRGDVRLPAGAWLGGPELPTRIEGFAVEWPDMPAGLTLRYAVRHAGSDGAAVALGGFAGTRGRGLPLTAVSFELGGPLGGGLVITAEAAFLAALLVRQSGRRVTLAGPSRREPLVGLRLMLAAVRRATAPDDTPSSAPPPA